MDEIYLLLFALIGLIAVLALLSLERLSQVLSALCRQETSARELHLGIISGNVQTFPDGQITLKSDYGFWTYLTIDQHEIKVFLDQRHLPIFSATPGSAKFKDLDNPETDLPVAGPEFSKYFTKQK